MKRALLALMAGVVLLLTCGAGSAHAAPQALGLPSICHPAAPVPQAPDSDLPGLFLAAPADPAKVSDPADPNHLLEQSGMSGMTPFTYDLGCALDVSGWTKQLSASADQTMDSKMVLAGQTATASSDAIDRLAWSPTWITSLLGALAGQANGVITRQVILPFLGVGLMIATLALRKAAASGDMRRIASHLMWIAQVLIIGTFVTLAPTMLASSTQQGMGAVTSVLHSDGHGSLDPATAATDDVMRNVHYQGWLRRTFGTSDSATAVKYGPRLLADTRMTWWQEQQAAPGTPAGLAFRKTMLQAKADDFKKVAQDIKANDPATYAWFTGQHGSSGVGLYEMGFAFVAAFFRLAVDLLMVLCLILLTVLGICWLLASPYLVLPRGHQMGQNLLNMTTRAIGFVVIAGLGSWLFGIYTSVVMQPGWPTWVSFLLLLVGTFVFWTALRPDRRALSLLTAGRIRGNGQFTRNVFRMLVLPGTAGMIAGRAFGAGVRGEAQAMREEAPMHEQHNTVQDRVDAMFDGPNPGAPPAPERTPLYPGEGAPMPVFDRPGTEWTPDPTPPPAAGFAEEYHRPVPSQQVEQNGDES